MSVTGFGFHLIAVPLLLLLLDSKTVITCNALFVAIISIPVLLQSWHLAKPKQIALLGIGSIAGVPLGILFLSQISAPISKLFISLLVIVFAILLAKGHSYRIKKEGAGSLISGFIGGTLMSSTGLGGPPVALFLLNQAYEKLRFRANLAGYFIICGLSAFIALGISGTVSSQTLVTTSTFIPVVALGYFLGIKILPLINAVLFKKIALAIAIMAGITGGVTSVLALMQR